MKRVLLITSKKKKMERKKEKKNTKPGFLRKKESTCLKKVRKVEDYQSNYLKNVLVSTKMMIHMQKVVKEAFQSIGVFPESWVVRDCAYARR